MYYLGLDLGQRRDFLALAVVEKEQRELSVVHLERMELGDSLILEVVTRVCEVMRNPKMGGACKLVVDATGVGAPVVDLLRAAGMTARLTAVTITSGERATGQGERWRVPRGDLLAGSEVALEAGELKICRRMKDAERLVRELERMESEGGGGEHDDLVFAVALAVWRARRAEVGFGVRGLVGF